MKGLLSLVCATLLLASTANAYVGFGVCNFGKEVVPSVVCYGPAVLKQTTIQGDMKIAGSLSAENITVGAMTVSGDTDIANSTVNGASDITGALHSDHTNFGKGINIQGEDVLLNHSVIKGSMTISSSNNTPYLKIQCSSAITGTVVFDGKPGVIQITGDSAVQGKVTNGAMEFVKKSCT